MSSPLHQIVNAFEDTYKRVNGLNDDWIKSEFCTECEGAGFMVEKTYLGHGDFKETFEQCAECEHLHQMEVRADIQHDIEKGN